MKFAVRIIKNTFYPVTYEPVLEKWIEHGKIGLVITEKGEEAFKLFKVNDEIIITLENASVARRLYKNIKSVFDIGTSVTVRNQKRFRIKQIYILTIKEKVDFIKESLNLDSLKSQIENEEEKIAFIRGAFLAIGNISNPQTSGYHLEFICSNNELAQYLVTLLESFNLNAKIVQRGYKFVVYLNNVVVDGDDL